ncbi:LOW QUALITY PROTEIN: sodium-independent sulfate anion transporter-like [Pollicipes pollicipes]|uniref:LOW QUALITY PROTEIN: sodium-independent sulfate anion transporter-like n=1 Tax=Pollicipes pollicipes TaxID=41117 RepID=UPI001884E8AD|nr:LOW QUALITY PROTEIN: sodium-independent sulfate anion transporter-like [Pollicipes pollicipes]
MPPQNLSHADGGLPADIDLHAFPVTPYQDEEDSSSDDSSASDLQKLREWASGRARQVFSKDTLLSTLPILSWAPKYTKSDLIGDTIAGLTVGLTVIPQGIAYGSLAGLSANYGLYSSFVGCFVYCIFGSSRAITIGPTAIMALMTHEYGFHGNPDIANLLAFLAGIVILLAGVLQLGFLIDFMSGPVIAGFTSAAAITIAVSQLKGLFGIKVDGDGFIATLRGIGEQISDTNVYDLTLGCICIAILISMREMRRLPMMRPDPLAPRGRKFLQGFLRFSSIARNAILVILAGIVVIILKANDLEPFTPTSSVPAGLPKPKPPPFSTVDGNHTLAFSDMTSTIGVGIGIVPLLAVVENIAIAKAFSEGKRLDTTQEMIALGLSNIAGSFFSAMPVTGSFSRTAVNHSSGVRTPLGGVFTGLLVICALQFLTPYFVYIPKATLSAIIISAVIYMIELSVARPMWRSRKVDLLPFLATFLAGVFWGLEYGIGIGTAISLGMILFKAARPKVVTQTRKLPGGSEEYIYVYPDSGLTYPAAEHVRAVVTDAAVLHGRSVLSVVLDCNNVRYSDFTSAECMNQLVKEFHERGQQLVFVGMKSSIRRCWDGAGHADNRLSCVTIADAEHTIADHLHAPQTKVDLSGQ